MSCLAPNCRTKGRNSNSNLTQNSPSAVLIIAYATLEQSSAILPPALVAIAVLVVPTHRAAILNFRSKKEDQGSNMIHDPISLGTPNLPGHLSWIFQLHEFHLQVDVLSPDRPGPSEWSTG